MSPLDLPEDALDEAWLLARARGEPFEHPDPERAAAYLRLEKALADLPLSEAPEGWQAKVVEAMEREPGGVEVATKGDTSGETPARSRRIASPRAGAPFGREVVVSLWHWLSRGGPAALAAGAALALLRWGPWWPKSAEVAGDGWGLEVQVLPGPRTRGNESPEAGGVVARGTSLALKAAPGPGGELRVYRDRRELVLRCPGGPGCREAHEGGRGVLRAELTLGTQGLYRAVLLSGPKVPAPSGEEDADLAAAVAAGAKIHVEPPWQVY